MVETAVADVIRPAVAAEDPDGLFAQVLGVVLDVGQGVLGLLRHFGVRDSGFQGVAGDLALGADVEVVVPGLGSGVEVAVLVDLAHQLLHLGAECCALLLNREADAHAELGVVLKQGAAQRGAEALLVGAVGEAGEAGSPDLRAAGCGGNVHMVAEQLGNELGVRRLAAACAGAVELQQGLVELAALDGVITVGIANLRQSIDVLPVGFLVALGVQRLHRDGLGRADGNAAAAALAVEDGAL